MLRHYFSIFIFFVFSLFFQSFGVACEKREIIELDDLSKIQILENMIYGFLVQRLDEEEIKRYAERKMAPNILFPRTIFEVSLNADTVAQELIRYGLTIDKIQPLFLRVKNSLLKPDPFLFFALLKAIFRQLAPEESGKNVFTLMARMVMDAPFVTLADNTQKIGFSSFRYFSHCAKFYGDLNFEELKGKRKILDYWQYYFFEEAYPYVLPWLTPLYYFYVVESNYITETPEPFSDEEWPALRTKITSADRFYDDEWLETQAAETTPFSSSFEYYARLEEFLIKDVNIYWWLLPKLANKDADMQADFLRAMKEAGADPETFINSRGLTATKYASILGISLEPEGIHDPSSKKRKAVPKIRNNAKRFRRDVEIK